MKKQLLFIAVALLLYSTGFAQSPVWTKTDGKSFPTSSVLERISSPAGYQLYQLNLPELKLTLQAAPERGSGSSDVIVTFPVADGLLEDFRIYKAGVMHPELAAKHPDMQSYTGQSTTGNGSIIRFSITPYGLHTMVFAAGKTIYTDPYTKDLTTYIVYNKSGLTTSDTFLCGVTGTATPNATETSFRTKSVDGVLRTYRLAMACTIEYADFHINEAGLNNGTLAQKKAAVLAAMVVTMTRLNGIYERDLSLTMQLVPNNDDVIFIESDNFDNFNTNNSLLDQSQEAIDAIIGPDNYDIGHTVSTGGGGVAQLWSPCSGSKARGITGLGSPVGDPFDVDFVAHEMGHQFGGNHSFNNECGGNRSDNTAYEPGSGTTIMAYAGVCDPSVQPNSDAHFHINSINEMSAFISNDGNCSQNTVTGNVPPVVNAGADYIIPKGTAFILEGTATDANNDAMTYCWEQMNIELSVQPPSPDSTEGPNFRSVPPKNVPKRYMPDISEVLNNNLMPTWEVVSNVERSFSFAFTVRDNNPAGGQVVTDGMEVNVSGTAGPFEVTSPNSNVSWQAGLNRTVSWNVAGTTANGVNTPYVDILLSTDGGYNYPTVLALKVPNDGSETVTVPVGSGEANRIMVRGHENIFYDLSNTNFAITAPATTMAIAPMGDQNKTTCPGNTLTYNISYQALGNFTGVTTLTATGNPAGSTLSFSENNITASGTVVVSIDSGTALPGFYSITVIATSGTISKTVSLYMEVLNSDFGTVSLTSPSNNSPAVDAATQFTWTAADNATAYEIEIATDAAFTGIADSAIVTTTAYTAQLAEGVTYHWRVAPANNGCIGQFSETFTFRTGETICTEYTSSDVPVIISDQENATVNSTLVVTGTLPVNKVSVSLDIIHTWVGDLTVKLTSPQGTEIDLFTNICDGEDNINAIFDDNGSIINCQGNPVLSGLIMPQEGLALLNGEIPQGIWTLSVADNFEQDGGQVNSWSLNICSLTEVELGTKENILSDFMVYPNPNSGTFTFRLNSLSENDINVSVYDMRGRQIITQKYASTGTLEQNISLGKAQAGVYVIILQEGANKITKKIIVN